MPCRSSHLDSEVDLDRTRWLIVRREQSWVRHTKPLAQEGANEIWIRVLRIERIACQNLLPKRHNLRNYAANVNMVAAIPAAGVMVPPSTGTGIGPPLKQAFETALNAPDLRRSGRQHLAAYLLMPPPKIQPRHTFERSCSDKLASAE